MGIYRSNTSRRSRSTVIALVAIYLDLAVNLNLVFFAEDLLVTFVAGEVKVKLAHSHFIYAIVAYFDSVLAVANLIVRHSGVSAMLAGFCAGAKRSRKKQERTYKHNNLFHIFPFFFHRVGVVNLIISPPCENVKKKPLCLARNIY